MGIDCEILREVPSLDDRMKKTKLCGKGSKYLKKKVVYTKAEWHKVREPTSGAHQ